MPRNARTWRVLPHGRLQRVEDNLWCVEGPLPGMTGMGRRIAIVRHADGSLMFYGALPMDDETLDAVRALGTPRYLVVPHGWHRIDAHPFREKLGLAVYCPPGAVARVSQVTRVDGTLDALPADPSIRFAPIAGTKIDEHALFVTSGDRVSYVSTDIVQWYPDRLPLLFRLLGFHGGPKVVAMFRVRAVSDRAALSAALDEIAETPGLSRIITSHGANVESDAPAVMRRVAADLRGA